MENFEGEINILNSTRGKIFKSMIYVYFIHNTKKYKLERQSKAYENFLKKIANKNFSSHLELVKLADDISPGLGSTTSIFKISEEFGLLSS